MINMQNITFPAVSYGQKIGFLPLRETKVEGIWEQGAKETKVLGPMAAHTGEKAKYIHIFIKVPEKKKPLRGP
jgi:hypothetical protein